MRKTNFLGTAFSVLFALVLFNAATFAQSTDIDNPTLVTQSTVQGKHPGNSSATLVYYYTFTAGPGILKITTDQRSVGITANANLSWELTDANFKKLGSEDFYQVTTLERRVSEIKLTKKQKVVLKVDVTEDVKLFKFMFSGAVNFTGDGDEVIPDISDNNPQLCMPRNGVFIMTMNDGKKVKVDLSKVQKIEVQ